MMRAYHASIVSCKDIKMLSYSAKGTVPKYKGLDSETYGMVVRALNVANVAAAVAKRHTALM